MAEEDRVSRSQRGLAVCLYLGIWTLGVDKGPLRSFPHLSWCSPGPPNVQG